MTVCAAQAKEKRQAKEAQLAKAQMDAARRGGVSWGMAEEAALEEDLDSVTEGAMLAFTTMLAITALQHLPNSKNVFLLSPGSLEIRNLQ